MNWVPSSKKQHRSLFPPFIAAGGLAWSVVMLLGFSLPPLRAQESPTSPSGVPVPERSSIPLSLKKAVEIALAPDGNTRMQIARELVKQAKARESQVRGALLPNLESSMSWQNQTRNLAAYGIRFSIPGTPISIPELVGPFNTYDVRAMASLALFDFSAIRRYQAAGSGSKAAVSDRQHTENEIMALTAKSWLTAWRQSETLKATQANVSLAESVFRLTQNRKEAGTGTGIDVTRAQVQLANEQQRLLLAQSEHQAAILQLLKAIGTDLGSDVELPDSGTSLLADTEGMTAGQFLEKALSVRSDYRAQTQREESARLSYSSTKWERLPSLTAFGDYGSIGSQTDHLLPTHTYGVSMRIPLFDGGRRDARRLESAAQWEQEKIKTRDLRAQIELEVRLAIDRLQTANQQMKVAEAGLQLAQSEVAQSQRRYEAGVANSLEVTDAQTRLARARDNQIAARYLSQLAQIDLGEAMGVLGSWIQ